MRIVRWFLIVVAILLLVYGTIFGMLLLLGYQPDTFERFAQIFASQPEEEGPPPRDLSEWTDEELAAQMLIVMSPSYDPVGLYMLARIGVGGILLSSDEPYDNIAAVIKEVQGQTPRNIRMFIASDEEGGELERMQRKIGELPSAKTMGTWKPERIRDATFEYGRELHDLGINLVAAPVADLAVPGTYMTEHGRTFSDDPQTVADCVVAWSDGMRAAGIAVMPKHWPGIGSARDTHLVVTTVPSREALEKAEMVPFIAALESGAEMIMVGHVVASDLTEPNTPASISPSAMAYLREKAGEDVIIVVDEVGMEGANTTGMPRPIDEAVIQSAIAGADLVMIGALVTEDSIASLTKAIADGRFDRMQAEDSVRRILRLKEQMGLMR